MSMNSSIRSARRFQRGATMVSVMLLTVSLLAVGVLVIRSSTRELDEANAAVARERALMSAQAAVELAAAQYRSAIDAGTDIDVHLAGFNGGAACPNNWPTQADCIPGLTGSNGTATGQRNPELNGLSACGGRPCMRPGAIARLPDLFATEVDWFDIPLSQLIQGADPEARVTVWVRNNTSEALGGTGSTLPVDWVTDEDGRVVITAMAQLRNTTVAIEQEVVLSSVPGAQTWNMQTPDEGYGGGHNNDNGAVEVCSNNYVATQP